MIQPALAVKWGQPDALAGDRKLVSLSDCIFKTRRKLCRQGQRASHPFRNWQRGKIFVGIGSVVCSGFSRKENKHIKEAFAVKKFSGPWYLSGGIQPEDREKKDA